MGTVQAKCCGDNKDAELKLEAVGENQAAVVTGDAELPVPVVEQPQNEVAEDTDAAKEEVKEDDAAKAKAEEVPFTVDLNDPPVDVKAPLDDRDVELVQQTFARAALLGAETVGIVLFKNIFSIAPEAKNLFPFKDDVKDLEDLASSSRLKAHGTRVVGTVGTAVSLLRDLPTLVPVLHELGLKHVGYSVVPEHYDVVGQALIKSLQTALGPNMTTPVTNAWLKVYGIVKATMLEKCDYGKLKEKEKAAAAKKKGKSGKSDVKKKSSEDVQKKPKKQETDAAAKEEKETKAEETAPKEEAGGAVDKAVIKARDAAWKKIPPAEQKEKAVKLLELAKKGDVAQATKMIVEDGVSANCVDGDGWTPLMKAAEANKVEMINFLFDQGADSGLAVKLGEWGNNALHHAARQNHQDAVKVLLARGNPKKDAAAKNFQGKLPKDYTTDDDIKKMIKKASK